MKWRIARGDRVIRTVPRHNAMRVAISKRRAKRLAAGTIEHVPDFGVWYLTLYMVVDGMCSSFGATPHESLADALLDGNDTLKCGDDDWTDVDEEDLHQYILVNTRNVWNVEGDNLR